MFFYLLRQSKENLINIITSWIVKCSIALICGVMVLVLAPMTVWADNPEFSAIPFGILSKGTLGVATGDLDNDGDFDIVTVNSGCDTTNAVCNQSDQSYIYFGEGKSNLFSGILAGCAQLPSNVRCLGTPHRTVDVALGDMNGDGALDIVTANISETNIVYINDGLGNFVVTNTFGASTDQTRHIALGDMDADGDYDIVTVDEQDKQDAIYFNDGNGQFTTKRFFGTTTDRSWSLAIGDVNGDYALDIVIGNDGNRTDHIAAPNVIYLNDGLGNFYQGTGMPNCVTPPANVRCFGWSTDRTHSVAIGDLNHDNKQDIVVGNWEQPNAIYLNDGNGNFYFGTTMIDCNVAPTRVYCFDSVSGRTSTVGLGDMNQDGTLDIITANVPGSVSGQDRIFILTTSGVPYGFYNFGRGNDYTWNVSVADIDNNGALDILSGNANQLNEVNLSNGSGQMSEAITLTNPVSTTSIIIGDPHNDNILDYIWDTDGNSLTFADIDQDDDLDLVFATYLGTSYVRINDGTGIWDDLVDCNVVTRFRCFGSGNERIRSVATGDMDGDGDLDIITASEVYTNVIYFNNGSGNFYRGPVNCLSGLANFTCFGSGTDETISIAVGDINRDGALDIVAGNFFEQNQIYFNDGKGQFAETRNFGTSVDRTISVAVSDLNGDGWSDIVVGNMYEQNAVYFNDESGNFYSGATNCLTQGVTFSCFGQGNHQPRNIEVHDMNGDGALDIVVGNYGFQSEVYINDGLGKFNGVWSIGDAKYATFSIAVGDLTGDRLPDIVLGNWWGQANQIITNTNRYSLQGTPTAASLTVLRPVATGIAPYFSSPFILDSNTIYVQFFWDSAEDFPFAYVRGYYSPDGGGRWLPAMNSFGTNKMAVPSVTNGTVLTYSWDVLASGFFGQSDNVVFRLEAYPSFMPRIEKTPGPFQWSYVSDTTFPFRLRGTQVRVNLDGQPVAGAFVFRIPEEQKGNGQIMGNGITAFRTNAQGYLSGHDILEIGDQLIALVPLTQTQKYTIYQTNALAAATGLNAYKISQPGVQTVTLSSSVPNTLTLFNLTVSLEWDARNDLDFMAQLANDIQRTSQILFDLSNGQAALGNVSIYHDKGNWGLADVVVVASNKQRPSAIIGGVVVTGTNDIVSSTLVITNAYVPGQVRIGANWNRFGNPSGTLGEDWPRVLAHELSHYLFFLSDNYIGVTPDKKSIKLVDCAGSVMTNPYEDDDSEWLNDTQWYASTECQDTMANRYLGRSDWATVRKFYPFTDQPANPGPSHLPIEVTLIQTFAPTRPVETLPVPLFSLVDSSTNATNVVPDGRGQVFLLKRQDLNDPTDDYIISLGVPVGDVVNGRGAAPGDRLCVFDYSQPVFRFGCLDPIGAVSATIRMQDIPNWEPQVQITALNGTTVAVSVTGKISETALSVQLLPAMGVASHSVPMIKLGNTFTQVVSASDGAYYGYVRIFVPGNPVTKESIVEYNAFEDWGGKVRFWATPTDAWGGKVRFWAAPAFSWGGQSAFLGGTQHVE